MQEQCVCRKFKACVTDASFNWGGRMCILELGSWSFVRACGWEKSSCRMLYPHVEVEREVLVAYLDLA